MEENLQLKESLSRVRFREGSHPNENMARTAFVVRPRQGNCVTSKKQYQAWATA